MSKTEEGSHHWFWCVGGLLAGLVTCGLRIGDPFQVCEIMVFLIATFGVFLTKGKAPPVDRALILYILVTLVCVGIVFERLISAGDKLGTAGVGALKIALFFVSGFVLVSRPKVAKVALLWMLSFMLGVIIFRISDGFRLYTVAKYTCPPAYALLVVIMVMTVVKLDGATKVVLASICGVAAGGVIGGYRGSAGGAAILVALTAAVWLAPKPLASLLRSARVVVAVLLVTLAFAVPALVVELFPASSIKQSAYATKSNVERLSSLEFALYEIGENPLTGRGVENSFLDLQKRFIANGRGFEATSSVHNQLIDIALFGGVVAAVAFFAVYACLIARMISSGLPIWLKSSRRDEKLAWRVSICVTAAISISFTIAVAPFTSQVRVVEMIVIAAFSSSLLTLNGSGRREIGHRFAGAA